MNISASTDLTATTIAPDNTRSLPPPPPSGGKGEGPVSDTIAIEQMGGTQSTDLKDSLMAQTKVLEDSGASYEEILSFVDSELEANGVDVSPGHQRSGQFVDIMS